MAIATVGNITAPTYWTLQPGSPRFVTDGDGVATVSRTYLAEGDELDLKTKLATYTIGTSLDSQYAYAVLETATGSLSGVTATVNLTYRGRPTGFVEQTTSPRLNQKSDGTWSCRRTFIGPLSEVDAFLGTYSKYDADPTYTATNLRTKGYHPAGVALAIVELNYEGTIGTSDTGSYKEVSRQFLRSHVTFSPWTKSGFQSGPQITGTYYREAVTVNYVKSSEPSSPQYSGELSNGSDTYILEWTPSSFDPSCAPHNLKKVSQTTNFSTRSLSSTGPYQCSETHEWLIIEAPVNGEYSPSK